MVPALAQQAGKTVAPSGRTPQGAVPSMKHPMVGDGTFLPADVPVRSTVGVDGFDRSGTSRIRIGGANGASVTEKVVNITRTDAVPQGPDERAPYWSSDERKLYYSRANAGGRYALYYVGADEPVDVATPTAVSVSDPADATFDYFYPAINSNGNRVAFIRSSDGRAVGENFDDGGKTWQLYVSDLPPGSGFINTAPLGNTNLRSLTEGRDFTNGAGGRARITTVGRPAWLGANDLVFSAKLEGDNNYHLFTVNVQSGVLFQLTAGPCSEENPAVSADGRYIAFDSNSQALTTGESYISAPGDPNRRLRSEADPGAIPPSGQNPGAVRNIFTTDNLGRDIRQFTGRYTGAPAVSSVEPAWSGSGNSNFFNTTGNSFYISYSSNRIPTFATNDTQQTTITGWAVGPGNTSSIYYAIFTRNAQAFPYTRLVEAAATDLDGTGSDGSRRLDTANSTLATNGLNDVTRPVFRDRFPTWAPIIRAFRIGIQSNRNGNYNTNGFGTGFVPTARTLNNVFIASLIDITAPTLVRYDTSSPTGEIVHINLVTNPNQPFNPSLTASVRSRDQGITPGSRIHFAVRVDDREAGLRPENSTDGGAVYLQIKNPNSKYQSRAQGGNGVEHKEFFGMNQAQRGGFVADRRHWVFYEGTPPVPIYLEQGSNLAISQGAEYECHAISAAGSLNTFTGDIMNGTVYYSHRYGSQGANAFPPGGVPLTGPCYVAGLDDGAAFSGINLPPLDGRNGRQNVWLRLTPIIERNEDGTPRLDGNGNTIPVRPADGAGGVLYGAEWNTPSEASDWYVDVICYDNAVNPFNVNQRSNAIIYDNVWGLSTAAPISGQQVDILVVMDHALGQKFFSSRFGTLASALTNTNNLLPITYGAESYYTEVDMARLLPNNVPNAPPTPGGTELRTWGGSSFNRTTGPVLGPRVGATNLALPNTLGVGAYNDTFLDSSAVTIDGSRLPVTARYSIWRILSRGAVPPSLLQDYLPQVTTNPPDTAEIAGIPAERDPRTIQHATRYVVWASPFSGNQFVGAGSITDIQTQNNLETFVTSGGRLFISGQDIGYALAGSGQSNRFFNNILKARFVLDDNFTIFGLNAAGTGTTFNGNYVGQLREDQGSNSAIAFGRFDGNTPFVYTPLNATSQGNDLPYTNFSPTATERIGDGAFTAAGYFGAPDAVQANPSTTPAGLPAGTPPDATDEFLYNNTPADAPGFAGPGVAPTAGTNYSAIIASSYPVGTSPVGVRQYNPNVPFTPQGKVVYASCGFESISQGWYTVNTSIWSFGRRTALMFAVGNLFRTGTVTGRVVDNNGSPVNGALVRAVFGGANFNQKAAGTALTDESGNFQIVGLQPGFYSVFASQAGFYTQHDLGNFVHGGWRSNTNIQLKKAGPGALTGIRNTGTNSFGGVFEADGVTPIPNIEIQLRRREPDGRFTAVTTRSSDGNTPITLPDGSVTNLPAGAYSFPTLLIVERNAGYQVIANPRTFVNAQGQIVPKPQNPDGSIPGYNPIYGEVRVLDTPQPEVRKGPAPATEVLPDPNPGDPNSIGPTLFIKENQTAQIDFLLPSAPQKVNGQVVDQDTNAPLANGFVSAALASDPNTVIATGTTDNNGNYSLQLVNPTTGQDPTLIPGGTYIVTATVNGYSTAVPPSERNGVSVRVGGSTQPTVTAEQIRLKKLPPGSVSGLVRRITGVGTTTTGVGGATVTLFAVINTGSGQQQAANASYTATVAEPPTTASDGYVFNFKIDNVDPGSYNAYVSKPGQTGSPTPFTLTVTSGTETRNVNFTLQPPKIYGAGVQLISVPQDFSAIPTRSIFNLTPNGDNDGDGQVTPNDQTVFNAFNVADWTGTAYQISPDLPLRLGKGYFARFGAIAAVNVQGTPVATPTYTIDLSNGWNLIGHPYSSQVNPADPAADIDISSAQQVTYSYTAPNGQQRSNVSLAQAVADNAAQNVIYSYTGSNAGGAYVQGALMKPWFGYWFRVFVPMQMTVRYPGAATRAVKVNGKFRSVTIEERERPVLRNIDSRGLSDWRIQIAAQQGDLRDTDNSVGVASNATDGFDNRYDNEKPPMVQEAPGVYVSVLGTAAGGRSTTFSDNIKSANGQNRTWEFTVETTGGNREVTVYWPNIARLPRGVEPVLVDETTGKRVAMRGTSSFRFAPTSRAARKFRVEVAPPTSLPLDILNLQPNTTRSMSGASYRFTFMTTRSVDVDAEVKTLTGRTVRRFRTRATGGATTSINWNGRDEANNMIPPGPYVLSITARDERGGIVTRNVPFQTLQ
jgi:hypothetical protein